MIKTNAISNFQNEVVSRIESLSQNEELQELSRIWMLESGKEKWSYNFNWFGRPAIQFPNDAWAMQEIIWQVKPDLIIESGVAHGGSLVYYAALLSMLDLCEALETGSTYNPKLTKRKVLGLDIDIRLHNRTAIEAHPMYNWIEMIEGSSIDQKVIDQVTEEAKNYKCILVALDSNHTHEHVLSELNAYAQLVTKESYCVVFDTIVEDMPIDIKSDRPWEPGNSPKTAVHEYLKNHSEFIIDSSIHTKLQITVAPDGFLKRIT
jgi:cephalosporin hydroxylase